MAIHNFASCASLKAFKVMPETPQPTAVEAVEEGEIAVMAETPHQSTAVGRNLQAFEEEEEIAETADTPHQPTAADRNLRAVKEAEIAVEVAKGDKDKAHKEVKAAFAKYEAAKDQGASPEEQKICHDMFYVEKKVFDHAIETLRIAMEDQDRARQIAYQSTPANKVPWDVGSFDQMLQISPTTSHQRAAIQDAFESLNPYLLNPWSQDAPKFNAAMGDGRKNEMRKKSAKHYNRYRKRGNLARCSVTGIWGDCNTVVGAHLLPLGTTTTNLQISLNMEGKLNDMRNVIPMLKTIERAYDTQRLCVVLYDHEGSGNKVKIRTFDPALNKEIVHGTTTFGDLEGKPFELPEGENKEGPFKRCLSFHAQTGYSEAKKRGWSLPKQGWSGLGPPPIVYGSPLDTNKIAFVNKCPSTFDETSVGSALTGRT